jgi:UDP-glucose 4-epimerase
MAIADDMGGYYRVPADHRDLNYHQYVNEGNPTLVKQEDYHSHNSELLDVDGMVELLMKLNVVKDALEGKMPQ